VSASAPPADVGLRACTGRQRASLEGIDLRGLRPHWDDVPAVGEDFDRARAAIRTRVARLFGFMRPEPGTSR